MDSILTYNMDCFCDDTLHKSLKLFEPVYVDKSLQRSYEVDYAPACGTNVGEGRQIQFDVPPSQDYIELAGCRILAKVKLQRVDGKPLTEIIEEIGRMGPGELTAENAVKTFTHKYSSVTAVNSHLASLFKGCNVEWNNTVVSSCGSNFGYRHYLNSLLSYNSAQRKAYLRPEGFFEGKLLNTDYVTKDILLHNEYAYKENSNVTRFGNDFHVRGRIPDPIFDTDKLLLNYVNMRIELVRETDDFFYINMNEEDVKLKVNIVEMVLRVRHVIPTPATLNWMSLQLLTKPARYIYPHYSVVQDYIIESNITSKTIMNLLNNRIPRRLVMGIVSNQAKAGTSSKDPYAFLPHAVGEIGIIVNGQSYPNKPLKCESWENDGYLSMFESLTLGSKDSRHGITMDEYKNGLTLYGINLEPVYNASPYFETRSGEISVVIRFLTPTTQVLNLIVCAEYSRCVDISNDRYVHVAE